MKTMKHRKLHKIAALFLVVAIYFGKAVPCMANPDETTIFIRTPEDLVNLSKNCVYDEWSEGKTVILSNDISLEGMEFEPIPYFAGTFDGNGHTVSDFELDGSYYPAGLFGITKQGALICNLTVTGLVMPEGERNDVGGIVGINGGVMQNVTFSGVVSGQAAVGGIAGTNTETAVIENACVLGSIFGKEGTGGIAGRNFGKILVSQNEAYVNNTNADTTVSLEELHIGLLEKLYVTGSLDRMDSFTDSAGIAGYSSGMVIGCKNEGTVGYPHVGYNAGGIAGRNTGFISGCINEGTVRGRKDIGGIVGQAEPFIDVQVEVSDLYVLDGQLSTLEKQIDSMTDGAENTTDGIYSNLKNASGYIDRAKAAIEKLETGNAAQQSAAELLSEVTDSVNGISNELREAGTGMKTGTEAAVSDLRNVSHQADKISDTLAGMTDRAKNFTPEDVVADTSAANVENTIYGKVADCVNEGDVSGDMNAGGITGIMSVEHGEDAEEDMAMDISWSERKQYEMKAILYNCTNRGDVTAHRDGAAGICGKQDIGIITGCTAYGTVTGEEGNYVGGIVGLTRANVSNCIANCGLSGSGYVGGIAGSGYVMEDGSSLVENCYSLVKITDCLQFEGAIAGSSEGTFINNFFVSEELAGINRISYAGMAQQISFEELLSVPGIPEEMGTFTITFMADGKEMESLTFRYGDEIDTASFPEVLKKEGYDGEWNAGDLTGLCHDIEIEAKYTLYVTSLESEDKRENLRPVILAEGNFSAGDTLVIEAGEVTEAVLEGAEITGEVLEIWNISFSDDGQKRHTLRFLPAGDADKVKLYIKGEKGWEKAETTEIGSYLAFDVSETEVELLVVSGTSDWMLMAVAAVTAVILLVTVILIGRKLRKMRIVIIGGCGVLLAAFGVNAFISMKSQIQTGMEIAAVMTELLEKEWQSARLELTAEVGSNHIELDSGIYMAVMDEKTILCLEENERPVYFYDNLIILENGKVFGMGETVQSNTSLLKQIEKLYSALEITTTEEGSRVIYAITAEDRDAKELLNAFAMSAEGQVSSAGTVEVRLITLNGTLERIEITGSANLMNAMDTVMTVEAVIYDFGETETGQWEMPENVLNAIEAAGDTTPDVMGDDFYRLLYAWMEFNGREDVLGTVILNVECGAINRKKEISWSDLKNGTESVQNPEDVAKIPDILYEICLNGEFSSEKMGERYSYQLTLDEESIQNLAGIIAPDIQLQTVALETGVVTVEVEENEIVSIKAELGGTVNILLSEVKALIGAEFGFETGDK